MKNHFYLLLIVFLSFAKFTCEAAEKTPQLTQKDTVPGNYGEEFKVEGMIPLSKMLEALTTQEEVEGKISGTIQEVCVKKGCWLTLNLPNGEPMRVTFKNYGFFVPKNAHGYPVVLEGKAVKVVTDVKTLKHYAADGGASPEEIDKINEPKEEYTFVATGVLILPKI
ncbi:DUF4920 domain-containing protein [Echinicola strongylocentroti]|uniref:DUF4920 domain-containing protein n=1 Tax=Echinicola strongylocentroti TaxID=1795355 RepID=A0A2Z4INH1_9BACT|nr:DUF4920 domain-containing protein [Echinicola strongylocentroti]AWW32280.1 DUF4920 domain-containing protein [Echinicola strongylocentroti]